MTPIPAVRSVHTAVMVHTGPTGHAVLVDLTAHVDMVHMGHMGHMGHMVHMAATAPMGHVVPVVVLAPLALLLKSPSLLNLMTETTI